MSSLLVAWLALTIKRTSSADSPPTDESRKEYATECCVNVKKFGARGNGKTDDTAAIERAIDAAPPGSILCFPPGTYLTDGFIVKKGLHLLGPGRSGVTIQHNDNVSSFVIKVESGIVEGLRVNLANTSTQGIWLTGSSVRVQNIQVYSKIYTKKYNIGKDLAAGQIGIHLDGSELAYLEDVLVGRINGACVRIDSGCSDTLFNRLHVYTAVDGLVFNGKSGGIQVKQIDVAEISRYGIWIRGGRALVIDGFYTANAGPPTSKQAWSIYADASIEAIDGLKILNGYEEQSSSRSYFSGVYHGFIEGRLYNVLLGSQNYGQHVRMRGRAQLAQRGDDGKSVPYIGSLWRRLEDDPTRTLIGFPALGFDEPLVPATAGWGKDDAFEIRRFSDYSHGAPEAFVYRAGVTDKISYTGFLQGPEVAAGLAIADANGTVKYGRMTGNGTGRELSLGDTIRLTKYDGQDANVKLNEGITYFIIPVAKSAGDSTAVRRFHYHLQPMNRYH